MAQPSQDPPCSSFLCHGGSGKFRCPRCREATPPTVYCSEKCQKDDWRFHKEFCGKYAYTFDLMLSGSSNPPITRTFDVPGWFSFEMLHFTIQYGMGPWRCTHMHQFAFKARHVGPGHAPARDLLAPRSEVLRIYPAEVVRDSAWGGASRVPTEEERESLKLSDVFEPAGRLHTLVAADGGVCPLVYTYDFGDNWEHKLIYKGRKLARAARPLFSRAKGCGPVEDCGGPRGWNEVKAAFRVPAGGRTAEQAELVRWAQNASGLGAAFDPFKDPDVVQMNYEGRWENHLREYKNLPDEEFPDDDDMFGSEDGSESDY